MEEHDIREGTQVLVRDEGSKRWRKGEVLYEYGTVKGLPELLWFEVELRNGNRGMYDENHIRTAP